MKASGHKISRTNFKYNVIKIRKTVIFTVFPTRCTSIHWDLLPTWLPCVVSSWANISLQELQNAIKSHRDQVHDIDSDWLVSSTRVRVNLLDKWASRCNPCGPTPLTPRRVWVLWVRLASRRMAIFFSLRWQITRFGCSNHNNPHAGRTITRRMLAPFCVRSDSLRAEQYTQNIS